VLFKVILEDPTGQALSSDELVLPPPDPAPPDSIAYGVVRGCPLMEVDCEPGEDYRLNFGIDRFSFVPEPSRALQLVSGLAALCFLGRRRRNV
jgi:hypothetical protein